MLSKPKRSLAVLLAAIVSTTGYARADEEPQRRESEFLRLTRDAAGTPLSLDTAIATYTAGKGKRGLTVDLIGAVHLGDKSYYRALNEAFENYDVVLYELVAPAGEEIPRPDQQTGSPMRMIHRMMQSTLGLASQLEEIDYAQPNFVHADMSPSEMSEALRSRGDTPLTFALSAMADVMRQANVQAEKMSESEDESTLDEDDLFSMLTDPNAGSRMKQQMAEQFARMGASEMAMGPTIGQLLVSDRNEACMKVFQRELAKGRKKIAIFYGAAHLPDFEKRLLNDFGLKQVTKKWLPAWDLTVNAPSSLSPMSMFLKMLNEP